MKNHKYPLLLNPIYRQTIWGGNRLKDYGKVTSEPFLGESWELSVRKDAENIIINGPYTNQPLSRYLADCGVSYSTSEDNFPLLVKLIDAGDKLSLQVHPFKSELWYIVEAASGAEIVYGLKEGLGKDELEYGIRNKTLDSIVNTVKVCAGESYYIPTGLIHAIGSGILIAEVQENSDVTYRMHDYNRLQQDGTPRELHVEQSLETVRFFTSDEINALRYYAGQPKIGTIADCDSFAVSIHTFNGGLNGQVGASFEHILCIEGRGEIDGVPLSQGSSCFLPAGYGDYQVISDNVITLLISSPGKQ